MPEDVLIEAIKKNSNSENVDMTPVANLFWRLGRRCCRL